MTREDATTLPMIELAEMLVENSEDHADLEAIDIAETWDRYDLLEELERWDVFDEDN